MARYDGISTIKTSYNVADYHPLDTRMLVPTYTDLTTESNWLVNGESNAYNGMIVAVGSDTNLAKNGIYRLFDKNNSGEEDVPDVTKEYNWHKIAEASELADFVTNNTLAATLESYVTSDDVKNIVVKDDNITILTVAEQVVTNTNNLATLNTALSGIQATLENIGSAKTEETGATGLYLSVEQITASVDEINAKLVGIDNNTTVLQVIETTVEEAVKNIPAVELTVATEEHLGGIKSGSDSDGHNVVSVDYDTGIASVNTINVNSLVQNDGDVLILSGGGCLTQE